jgi:hypothetical protein
VSVNATFVSGELLVFSIKIVNVEASPKLIVAGVNVFVIGTPDTVIVAAPLPAD